MQESSGTLLYRHRDGQLEVLLVHPSGNYNRHAAWSIPKGRLDKGETVEQAARRETWEETGITAGPLKSLGSVVYKKSKKLIHAFAGEAPTDVEPQCASWEIDSAQFLPLEKAYQVLHLDQRSFLDRLRAMIETQGDNKT